MKYLFVSLSVIVLAGCQTTQNYVPTEKNKNPRTWQEKYAHCHREPNSGFANLIPGVSQVNFVTTTAKNSQNPECLVRGWDASFLLGMNKQQQNNTSRK